MEKSFLINCTYSRIHFHFPSCVVSSFIQVPLLPLSPNLSLAHLSWSVSQSFLCLHTHSPFFCPNVPFTVHFPCISILYVGHGFFKACIISTNNLLDKLVFHGQNYNKGPCFDSINFLYLFLDS
ncbi:hypothetical protein GOODEAATRI_026181 [Goodea atripinnis]|uniref:Uncharacterized protein n=1 Tax=Goodea atripinnis TaxID=208336 RepID=A0ABV0MXB3_9TELE